MKSATGDRLVLRDIPWLFYLFGALFTLTGLWLLLSADDWRGLIFVVPCAALIAWLPSGSLTADLRSGVVTFRRWSLFKGSSKREIPISTISNVAIEQDRGSFRTALVLSSGEHVSMGSTFTYDPLATRRAAEALRNFLEHGGERRVPVVEDSLWKLNQEGITQGIAWRLEVLTSFDSTVTRWWTGAASFPEGLLMVLQPGGGVDHAGSSRVAFQVLVRQWLRMFQFTDADLAALAERRPMAGKVDQHHGPPIDIAIGGINVTAVLQLVSLAKDEIALTQPTTGAAPDLTKSYYAIATAPEAAGRWLNATVVRLLADWAQRHPAPWIQHPTKDHLGSLCLIAAPAGVWLAFVGATEDPGLRDEILGLGAAIAQAQRSP